MSKNLSFKFFYSAEKKTWFFSKNLRNVFIYSQKIKKGKKDGRVIEMLLISLSKIWGYDAYRISLEANNAADFNHT